MRERDAGAGFADLRARAVRRARRTFLPAAAAVGLGLGMAPAASAQEWIELSARRQATDLETIAVDVEFMAGELRLAPAPEGLAYDVHYRYDARNFEPVREWRAGDGRGELDVGIAPIGSDGLDDFEHIDVDLDDMERPGSLSVALGTGTPIELDVTTGAAESVLELGGIPLRSLELATGASETRLEFDAPNPIPMERLVIGAGAAEVRAEGLGNAGATEYRFEGGVGDVTLVFDGAWRRNATAVIEMGLGSLQLRVPRDLGVRLTEDTFLASVDTPGFEQVGEAWLSPNWDTAEHRLDIRIEAAFGSIEIDYLD